MLSPQLALIQERFFLPNTPNLYVHCRFSLGHKELRKSGAGLLNAANFGNGPNNLASPELRPPQVCVYERNICIVKTVFGNSKLL